MQARAGGIGRGWGRGNDDDAIAAAPHSPPPPRRTRRLRVSPPIRGGRAGLGTAASPGARSGLHRDGGGQQPQPHTRPIHLMPFGHPLSASPLQSPIDTRRRRSACRATSHPGPPSTPPSDAHTPAILLFPAVASLPGTHASSLHLGRKSRQARELGSRSTSRLRQPRNFPRRSPHPRPGSSPSYARVVVILVCPALRCTSIHLHPAPSDWPSQRRVNVAILPPRNACADSTMRV